MISCIFTTAFYAIVISSDAITNITSIISNLQTNFGSMPRALYRVFQIAVRGGGILGGTFFTRWWEPEEWSWQFELFPKQKQHSVDTEHQLKSKLAWLLRLEIKTKTVQEQWVRRKMMFLLGYNLKIFSYWGSELIYIAINKHN